MTFCTLRRGADYGLGLRTERGILDVAAAEQALQGRRADHHYRGARGARRYRRSAAARQPRRTRRRNLVAEDKAKFGPCVTNPEKIVCIGLNYRKHAAETGNPVPKQPILFNKYNTALNCCGGEIAVSKEKAERFDYEAELVIVIGRTARNVSGGRRAGAHLRLLHRQRLHRARPAAALEPMDARQDARRLRSDRAVARRPPTRSTATT